MASTKESVVEEIVRRGGQSGKRQVNIHQNSVSQATSWYQTICDFFFQEWGDVL